MPVGVPVEVADGDGVREGLKVEVRVGEGVRVGVSVADRVWERVELDVTVGDMVDVMDRVQDLEGVVVHEPEMVIVAEGEGDKEAVGV